jgi:hypothetical protein
MMEIPLSRGKVALIDDDDYALVKDHRWCADFLVHTWYVVAHVPGSGASGRGGRTVYMHRLLLGERAEGKQVDHINHDGLDNRRVNLRAVTQHANMQNRRGANKNYSTGYRNVYRMWNGTYNVKMQLNRKNICIGTYKTLEDAIEAAAEARRRHMTHAPECVGVPA